MALTSGETLGTRPLPTALWNFWLTSVSAGRQRTFDEFLVLLRRAGFAQPTVTPTAGHRLQGAFLPWRRRLRVLLAS